MGAVTYHRQQRHKHLRIAHRLRKRGNDVGARRHLKLAQKHTALLKRAKARAHAAKGRGGVSGLTAAQRVHARRRAVQAALLAYRNRGVVHYTQGGSRWSGINYGLQSRRGQFPRYADCSSLATWCIWNALRVAYGIGDTVNGLGWRAGYTGTMLTHGRRVTGSLLPGDCVIYGRGFPGHHTAIYVGNGKVVSHGSEIGPLLLPVRYRGDVLAIRRFI